MYHEAAKKNGQYFRGFYPPQKAFFPTPGSSLSFTKIVATLQKLWLLSNSRVAYDHIYKASYLAHFLSDLTFWHHFWKRQSEPVISRHIPDAFSQWQLAPNGPRSWRPQSPNQNKNRRCLHFEFKIVTAAEGNEVKHIHGALCRILW